MTELNIVIFMKTNAETNEEMEIYLNIHTSIRSSEQKELIELNINTMATTLYAYSLTLQTK